MSVAHMPVARCSILFLILPYRCNVNMCCAFRIQFNINCVVLQMCAHRQVAFRWLYADASSEIGDSHRRATFSANLTIHSDFVRGSDASMSLLLFRLRQHSQPFLVVQRQQLVVSRARQQVTVAAHDATLKTRPMTGGMRARDVLLLAADDAVECVVYNYNYNYDW